MNCSARTQGRALRRPGAPSVAACRDAALAKFVPSGSRFEYLGTVADFCRPQARPASAAGEFA